VVELVETCLAEAMESFSVEARRRYDALVAVARETVVGLDFDGTLAPIVPDPNRAVIHPDGPAVLAAVAARVRAVALVTGRPARQVVELGRFDEVADALPPGARLLVRGQYGHEHWDSSSREFTSPAVPEGLAAFADELPGLLAAEDAGGAYVEDKGLALAVHTRRLDEPAAVFARLEPRLADAAERHGLGLEPGKYVLEVRAPGMHKGRALREVVAATDAGGVLFGGDDLGDLEAFEAARDLRAQGLPALLVCSGSTEGGAEQVLREVTDVVVPGPEGVLALLRGFAHDAGPVPTSV
jgi:trehalose 6-phosphate phosphatase